MNVIWQDEYIFYTKVIDPLIIRKKNLRSELEYDSDSNPEKKALEYIKTLRNKSNLNMYLLVASELSIHSKVRSHKGLLWGHQGLSDLQHRNSEIKVAMDSTRLLSIVNLKDFEFSVPNRTVLNSHNSLLVLTNFHIDFINDMSKYWISTDMSRNYPYDHDAIIRDLNKNESIVIIRYFFADLGRNEMIAAIGHIDFVDCSITPCFEAIYT